MVWFLRAPDIRFIRSIFIKTIAALIFLMYFEGCITWTKSDDSPVSDKKNYSYKIITDRNLEWSDFTGTADYTQTYTAAIYWKVFYSCDSVYTYGLPGEDGEGYVEPNLKVWYAIDERSWVKPRYKNDDVLKHEQGHLNIAKLCATEFKKSVGYMKPISRFNWKNRIDSAFYSVLKKCNTIQDMYDGETNHGLNAKRQEVWDKKIVELITKLK